MVVANLLVIFIYLSCAGMLIRRFIKQTDEPISIGILAEVLTIFALLLHGKGIFFTMQYLGGWDVSLFSTITMTAWLMAFIAFLSGAKVSTAHPGIIIYPLVALSLALQMKVPQIQFSVPLPNPALKWHIILCLIAYSICTLAALQAIILAIQEQHLRNMNIVELVSKLPPLQSMEIILFQLLMLGFLFLTIGLITGFMFLDDILFQGLAHKTFFSIISWCLFATLLLGRWRYGWRGKTAIKWTFVGFIFLVLSFIVSKFILEFILDYHFN